MTDSTIDWRTMEAGRELDRLIAERLGFKVIEFKTVMFPPKYALLTSENYLYVGNVIKDHPAFKNYSTDQLFAMGERDTEDAAWEDCPHYSTDLNAAIALPLEKDMFFALEVPGEHGAVECSVGNQYPRSLEHGVYEVHDLSADTPALAVCRAWLAWKLP